MTHGGNVHQASIETGLPVSEIIDFSASINPLGMPEAAAAAIRDSLQLLVHYPDPFAERLGSYFAGRLGIDPRSVVCGNGSTELIYLAARAFAPKRVLVPQPTFSEYARACAVSGAEVVPLRLSPQEDFRIDPDRFAEAMHGCNMAFLCNPNNPTGTVVERDAVLFLMEQAKKRSCVLVVDEAFIDFTQEHSVIREAATAPWIVILRSLTKFWALAGLRIGYAVLEPHVADLLRKHKEPWTVNTAAQQAAKAALEDRVYEARTLKMIAENRTRFLEGLERTSIEYVPPSANFCLFRMENAGDAAARLRGKGILVREFSNFAGLDKTYLRVAVRTVEQNGRLLTELVTCAV